MAMREVLAEAGDAVRSGALQGFQHFKRSLDLGESLDVMKKRVRKKKKKRSFLRKFLIFKLLS